MTLGTKALLIPSPLSKGIVRVSGETCRTLPKEDLGCQLQSFYSLLSCHPLFPSLSAVEILYPVFDYTCLLSLKLNDPHLRDLRVNHLLDQF